MRFEKLEQRCLMDGTGFGGFCTPREVPIASASNQVEYVVYGPMLPGSTLSVELLEVTPVTLVGEVTNIEAPRADQADIVNDSLVVEVPQLNVNGVLIGKQEVPVSTGLRAALDILEANGGYVQAWANAGIESVYRSGDTYYIEFLTPHEDLLVLGKRALVVDISVGAIYGFSMW